MITRQIKVKMATALLIVGAVILIAINAGGGSLEPNAPPGPTMHSLEDIYNVVSAGLEPPPQPLAFDCFLKIDGIPGESIDAGHKEWIEVLSYSHDVSQPAGAGRADHQDFSIVKQLDKSTPKLAEAVCTGNIIPYIQLNLRRADEAQVYMEYKMENAIVTSVMPIAPARVHGESTLRLKYVELGIAGGEALPMEEVTFNYRKINWTYIMGDGNSICTGWDIDANAPYPCVGSE